MTRSDSVEEWIEEMVTVGAGRAYAAGVTRSQLREALEAAGVPALLAEVEHLRAEQERHLDPNEPGTLAAAVMELERLRGRLHYALALLSDLEFADWPMHHDRCPICDWPKGGHHGTRHQPGCSLEAVLLDRTPERLVELERLYGDAALGADGNDRKRFRTSVVPALAPTQTDAPEGGTDGE